MIGHQCSSRLVRCLEQGEEPGDQEYSGGYHGGGVDQGADGCRALHGVGQPDVEGELGRLPRRAGEDADGYPRQRAGAKDETADRRCVDVGDFQGLRPAA